MIFDYVVLTYNYFHSVGFESIMSEEELAVDIRESEKSLLKKRKKQKTQEVQTARDQRFHF
jgi:hypothetical protein